MRALAHVDEVFEHTMIRALSIGGNAILSRFVQMTSCSSFVAKSFSGGPAWSSILLAIHNDVCEQQLRAETTRAREVIVSTWFEHEAAQAQWQHQVHLLQLVAVWQFVLLWTASSRRNSNRSSSRAQHHVAIRQMNTACQCCRADVKGDTDVKQPAKPQA